MDQGTDNNMVNSSEDQAKMNKVNDKIMLTANTMVASELSDWGPSQNTEKMIKIKVFTSLMIHAWRQRRADAGRLQKLVDRLQTSTIHIRNDLNVCHTRLRVEQNLCNELQMEVRNSSINMNLVRSNCDQLTISLRSMTATKEQLEQDLDRSRTECQALEIIANTRNEDLLNLMMDHQGLHRRFTEEQDQTEELRADNSILQTNVNNLREVVVGLRDREQSLLCEIAQQNREICTLRFMVENLEYQQTELTETNSELLQRLQEPPVAAVISRDLPDDDSNTQLVEERLHVG